MFDVSISENWQQVTFTIGCDQCLDSVSKTYDRDRGDTAAMDQFFAITDHYGWELIKNKDLCPTCRERNHR